MKSIRTRMVLLAAVGTLAAATGIGYAAIPHDQSAVISGCYEKRTGILRVIDAQAGKSCTGWELPLSWNQQGAQGLPGAPGPAGAPGPKGDKGDPGEPAPLYSAGTGLTLVGTQFQLAFDPATQSELNAEAASRAAQTAALRDQVTELETNNRAQSQQIAVLQAQVDALGASLQQLTAAISITGSHVTVNRSLHVTGSISNPRTTIP